MVQLNEKQQLWLTDFSNQQATKQQFDKERALKKAVITRIVALIDSKKDELREKLTFKVGDRMSLDVDGSQMTEADLTEYTPEQKAALAEVEDFIQVLTRMMEEPIVDRPNKSGVLEPDRLFTDQEISDELFTPLVRARLMPETLVPAIYSETAKLLEGSNKAYMEDLEEYTRETEDEEDDLVSTGLHGVSTLASIGQKLAKAFPGEDATLAADVLGLVSVGANTIAIGYDAIQKAEFKSASGSIIDNIGVLMKGILTLVVDEDVANDAANIYTAVTSVVKVSVAISEGNPGAALAELAGGMEAAMNQANKGDKDPNAGAIVKFICGQLKSAKHIDTIAAAAKETPPNFAGVVDGFTGMAKDSIAASYSYARDLEKIQSPGREDEIDDKWGDTETTIGNALDLTGAVLKTGEAVVQLVKADSAAAALESLMASLGGILSSSLALAKVDDDLAKAIGGGFTAGSKGGVAVVYLLEDPSANSAKAAELIGAAISGAMTSATPGNANVKNLAGFIESGFVAAAKGLEIKEAYQSGDPAQMQKIAQKMTSILRGLMGTIHGELSEDEVEAMKEGMTEEEQTKFDEQQAEFKEMLDEQSSVFDEEAISACFEALNSPEAKENLKREEETRTLERLQSEKNVMQLLKDGTASDKEAARDIQEIIAQMQKDKMIMQMALGVAKGGLSMATKWVPALGAASTAIQIAENLMAAANRAVQLREWLAHKGDLKSAQDALESSAANFVKNQKEQFAHYATQAAFKVAEMIGQILELSGIATAAGSALKAAAEAGAAIEEVIYKVYRKATLEAAWALTQKAFANPKNRRLGLEARALNPTLAKYSLAWSALVRENPMARNIMNDIGLNEGTLRSTGQDVQKVVKYMELKFSDDIQVRKKVDLADGMPNAVFDGKSWGIALTRAKAIGLTNMPSGKLEGLVGDAYFRMKHIDKRIKSMEITVEECDLYIQILETLDYELSRYRPLITADPMEANIPYQGFIENMRDACTDQKILARNALAEAEEFEMGQALHTLFASDEDEDED